MVSYYQDWFQHILKENSIGSLWILCTSVLCGIFGCKLVYDSSQLICAICFKHYSGLPKMKQIEWDNRSDLYDDDHQRGSILSRSSPLSTFVLGVSAGYFISDLAMIFWFYPALGGMEYVLHHLLSLTAIAYAMLVRMGQFYTFMALLSETTTPGINLRWYLDAAGMKRSKVYVINGVAIFLTWLVARILLFIYVFYHIFTHYDQIKLMPRIGYFLLLVSPCILSVLNLIWFGKITKGMIKMVSAKKEE